MAYTSSAAKSGRGTLFQVQVGSPLTFSTYPEVTEFTMSPGEPDEIEVTNMESTAKEFIYGLANRGTVTVKGNYDPANAVLAAMQTAGSTQATVSCKLQFPQFSTPKQFTFNVIAGPFSLTPDLKGVAGYTQTLKITGDITGPSSIS